MISTTGCPVVVSGPGGTVASTLFSVSTVNTNSTATMRIGMAV